MVLDRGRPLAELVASLTAVDGVGPWTAQYIALRMGEPDAFPSSDLGLRRAVGRLTGRTPDPRELEAISEAWRPWRAVAATHLWNAGRDVPTPLAEDERTFATMAG